jgi:hypothetical protein
MQQPKADLIDHASSLLVLRLAAREGRVRTFAHGRTGISQRRDPALAERLPSAPSLSDD